MRSLALTVKVSYVDVQVIFIYLKTSLILLMGIFFLPAQIFCQKISLFYFQKCMQINNLLCLLLALVYTPVMNDLRNYLYILNWIKYFGQQSGVENNELHIYLHKLLSNCILLLNSRLFHNLTSGSHVYLSACLSKLVVNALASGCYTHGQACTVSFLNHSHEFKVESCLECICSSIKIFLHWT